jgi:hypothetical protein
VHDEAGQLDEMELAEACAALIEDRIFSDENWSHAYTAPGGGFELDAVRRIAVKYGWALAHAEWAAKQLGRTFFEWSVARGSVATTVAEHRFLRAEIVGRGLPIERIELCPPGQIEPAIDYIGEGAEFADWLRGQVRLGAPLVFSDVCEKWAILPALGACAPSQLTLRFSQLGWLEAMRVAARERPSMFREFLFFAQERFVFDKPSYVTATTEDDIRTLPDVPDGQLEPTFVDDFRGRQMLDVATKALAATADWKGRVDAFLRDHATSIGESIVARMQQHAQALTGEAGV